MAPPRRVTQQDVARVAKVNRATVSLALRNDRSLPPHTCQRIQQIAKRLKYTPDPMLSALARYRSTIRPASFQGSIAWMAQTTPEFDWRKVPHFGAYVAGAEQQCRRYGYQLEIVDLGELGMSWKRAASLAHARGIQGLLLCPQPTSETDLRWFPWEKFSAITFGYTLAKPTLHSVAPAHHRALLQIFDQMHRRGYRRIGFIELRSHDERVNHNLLSAYLAMGHLHPEIEMVEPLLLDDWTGAEVPRWICAQRLDGLITCDIEFNRRRRGWKLPPKLGVAVPTLPAEKSELAGICESGERLGQAAVDLVVSMIQRGEKGVPITPLRQLIEGSWVEGRTLPERPGFVRSIA